MQSPAAAKNGFLKNLWQHKAHVLMCLPAFLIILIFSYVPMSGLVMAFKKLDYAKSIFASDWCGLSNFRYLFLSGATFWRITRNTLIYFAIFTVVGIGGSAALAIAIDQLASKRLAKSFQSVMVVPIFVSYVAVTYIVYAFFSTDVGVVNRVLSFFGAKPVRWYLKSENWWVILTIVKVWNSVGYGSILYYSVLTGVDSELYEAASIDGATKWQQVRKISIPMLIPTITIMLLLNVGNIMHSDTGLFYQVTKNSGSLYETTQVLDSFVLNAITRSSDFGTVAAATFYQSIVGLVMLLLSNTLVRKIEPDNALL